MSKQFKANITAVEGHWQHKVCARQIEITDAFTRRYKSHMTIFIPQLTPEHTKPCVFFHLKTNFSKAFFRVEHPLILAEHLEHLAKVLRSDPWLDDWDRITNVSERLIVDDLLLDEKYLDMDLFNQECNQNIPKKD